MRGLSMKWMLVLLALRIPAASTAALAADADSSAYRVVVDSTARPVTLAEALEMGRRNAPQAIRAEGDLRNSRASVRSAYASFIPSLSLSAGAAKQYPTDRVRVEDGQFVSRPWSYSAGLSANLALFEGGQRIFGIQQAKAESRSAEANQVEQRYLVDLAVKTQYYAVIATREAAQAAYAQLQQAELQRRAATLRVRGGSATKSDSLRSEILVNNASLALLAAENGIRVANAGLTRAIGAPELVTAGELEIVDPPAADLDEAELTVLAERGPAVNGAVANLDVARAAKSASWTDYLPSVNASYSRGGNGSGQNLAFGADDLAYNGSFRVGVSLPIFNQLGREEQTVRADVARDNAEAALRDARLAARADLTRYLGDYRIAEQRVRAQTASVAAGEEDLRVQQRRYQVGGGTLLDVLASQTQLDQALEALIRARYDQRIARAQLEALIGREL